MPYLDASGNPLGQAGGVTYLDPDGNPIGGDVRSQIAARAANPPPNARGAPDGQQLPEDANNPSILSKAGNAIAGYGKVL
jgi:hypothetical protein